MVTLVLQQYSALSWVVSVNCDLSDAIFVIRKYTIPNSCQPCPRGKKICYQRRPFLQVFFIKLFVIPQVNSCCTWGCRTAGAAAAQCSKLGSVRRLRSVGWDMCHSENVLFQIAAISKGQENFLPETAIFAIFFINLFVIPQVNSRCTWGGHTGAAAQCSKLGSVRRL